MRAGLDTLLIALYCAAGVPRLVGTMRGGKPVWVQGLRLVGRGWGVCLHAEGADALGLEHV